MITRGQWVQLIEAAWRERPIVWISGVRRVGKTCLGQSLPNVTYFDCELPRVRQTMTDPQGF
jgi:predicted AAA+ superfamily ATPase